MPKNVDIKTVEEEICLIKEKNNTVVDEENYCL